MHARRIAPLALAAVAAAGCSNKIASPSITAGTVEPGNACSQQVTTRVTLTGEGFTPMPVGTLKTASLVLPSIVLVRVKDLSGAPAAGEYPIPDDPAHPESSQVHWISAREMAFDVTPSLNLPTGRYDVRVVNPDGKSSATFPLGLTIEPPPTVTGTVPATICSGGGTLAVNGSGFLGPATVDLVPVTSGPAVLTSSSATVNAAGTTITASFGGGAVPPNRYDVIVHNQDRCVDPAPHVQVTAVTGPVAFFADPEVVFNGINTTVTVYVTTLVWPVSTVTIAPHGTSTTTSLTPIAVPGHPNRVQVVIPAGQAAGAYDLFLNDATTCGTLLPNAFSVTATTTVSLKSVTPAFGWTGSSTAVTVQRDTTAAAPNDQPFVATPRLFLNPHGNTTAAAVQVQSVSFVDTNTLTAVVPSGQPAGLYDLVLVNPSGTVGLLLSAFTVTASPPPVVAAVTPSSIVAATGQVVVVSGSNFDAVNGTAVALSCRDAAGAAVAPPPTATGTTSCGTPTSCAVTATVNAGALPAGSVCVLRLTNAGDGTFFDYSAIGVTNSSFNLTNPVAGSALTKGRRALVAAAGNATPASRFVYAVGGDAGAATTPFADAEVAPVDLFGHMGTWTLLPRTALGAPRAFAASAMVGRYLYVLGGTDGTSALSSAERAMILDPAEVPQLDVGDIVPAATGLDPGYWIYRVAAVYSAADLDNPGGESLPSDEVILKVPSFAGKKIQVLLTWRAPVDSLGAALPNVAGYNVYRTPAVNGVSGQEVLLTTVSGAATLQFTDDGSFTPGTQAPLPTGSLGRWAQLPAMATARRAAAGAAAFDPVTSGTLYVYALLGLDGAGAALASYEYLPVTVQANGHQRVGIAWKAGLSNVAAGRQQLGAWVATSATSSLVPAGTSYVYAGGGVGATGAGVTDVDAGKVAAGGDLGTFSAEKKFGGTQAGYGVCAANGQLFTFGGAGAAPSSGANSAFIVNPAPTLAANGWNSQGIALSSPRYLSGSAVQSAFIFLVGGQTGTGGANTSTELVIW